VRSGLVGAVGRSGGIENGTWIDLAAASGGDVLEVRPSGKPVQPGKGFRFWFYKATGAGGLMEKGRRSTSKQW